MSLTDAIYTFFHDHKELPFRSITVFNYLLEAALCGGILILLLLLVRRLFRGKLGNRVIYAAWLLVAVRLLVPLAIPNPLMNELRPGYSTDEAARPVADQIRVRVGDAMGDLAFRMTVDYDVAHARYYQANGDAASESAPQPSLMAKAGNVLQAFNAVTSYGWTGKWVLIAYLCVDGGVLLWMVWQNAAFRRRMKKHRVSTLSGELQEVYLTLCAEKKMKPLPVYLTDPLPTACLVGVLRPYIALPLTLTPEEARMALLHELCHHKVRDEWWNVLRNLCCVVQWFNPLVWIGARKCREDGELACDDRVTQGMDEDQRRAYANVLLATAARRGSPAITVLATGMTMTGKRLKQRLSAIIHSRTVRRGATAVFAVFSAVVVLFTFATAENRSGKNNLRLEKAINGMVLDNPYYEADSLWTNLDVTRRPITTAEEAAAMAGAYLSCDALGAVGFMRTDLKYSAAHAEEGWYVAATGNMGESPYCMLISDDGVLLDYNAMVFTDTLLDNQGRLPDNIDACMASYAEAFATRALGATSVTDYAQEADMYNLYDRYLYGHATVDGRMCAFTVRTSYPVIVQWHTSGVSKTMVSTQDTALYGMYTYFRDNFGVTEDQWRERCVSQVGWNETTRTWEVSTRLEAGLFAELADVLPTSMLVTDTLVGYLPSNEQPPMQVAIRKPDTSAESVEPAPSEQVEGVLSRDTMAYFSSNYTYLYQEEIVPAGTPYTVQRVITPEDSRFINDWAAGYTWQEIRYQSPLYNNVIDRWIVDPAETANLLGDTVDVMNPIEDRITVTLADGTSRTFDMGWRRGGSFTTPPDTAMPLNQVIELALPALSSEYNVTADDLCQGLLTVGYCTSEETGFFSAPYWQLDFWNGTYEIILHDPDGEILYTCDPSSGNG